MGMRMRRAKIGFGFLGALVLAGCMSGNFHGYQPNEVEEYDSLLEPVKGEQWYWVRGKALGDLDGDRKDEEVVLVTLQGGLPSKPGPIDKAVLLFCHRNESGRPQLLCRTTAFDRARSFGEAALPKQVYLPRPQAEPRQASCKVIEYDQSGRSLALVSLWDESNKQVNVQAWHAAFTLENSAAKRVFAVLATQVAPLVEAPDLDKDGRAELVVTQAVLPAASLTRQTELDPPVWPSVFSLNAEGVYVQNNAAFPRAYGELLLPWYENYVLTMHGGAEAKERAPLGRWR